MLFSELIDKINNTYSNLSFEEQNKLSLFNINNLDLSRRLKNTLLNNDYRIIKEILESGLYKLKYFKGMGKISYEELLRYLNKFLKEFQSQNTNNQNLKIWQFLSYQEKFIETEKWLSIKTELTEYFMNENSTLHSLSKLYGNITRERIRQKINRQLEGNYEKILFYCVNNIINKKQFKICERAYQDKDLNIAILSKINANYKKTLAKLEEKREAKKLIKSKKDDVFHKYFIEGRSHLDDFYISLSSIENYIMELNNNKLKIFSKKITPRSIYAKLSRKPNIVYVNQNRFLFIEENKIEQIISQIETYFYKLHIESGLWFISTKDPIVKELGFEDEYALHAFGKKYYRGDKMYFKNQPRLDFVKVQTLPKLIEKQLETWNINTPISIKDIFRLFNNSNYTKLQIFNFIEKLNKEKLKYIYYNKKIWRRKEDK